MNGQTKSKLKNMIPRIEALIRGDLPGYMEQKVVEDLVGEMREFQRMVIRQ